MDDVKTLANSILQVLRNTELLELSATIQMASMSGVEIEEIETAYKKFAYGLEDRIIEGIIRQAEIHYLETKQINQ